MDRDNPNIVWEGRELKNMGEAMEAIISITKRCDKEKACAFIQAYERICAHGIVRKNIAFGARYYAPEIATRIIEIFEVESWL